MLQWQCGWKILALLHFYRLPVEIGKMQMFQNLGSKAMVFCMLF
jgi:hypothetical protein